MSEYRATVEWQLQGEFKYATYSRAHTIDFSHGVQLPGNAAPWNIPKSVPWTAGADPEQQFVASLSTCHMLWFLHIAHDAKFVVERYRDEATGVLAKNAEGRRAMTQVTLRPVVSFSGAKPTPEQFAQLHHETHERCFIANSVTTEVIIEPCIARETHA
jgi:organic hydroperoxide reductase OsmC/OhrA